MSFKFEQKKVIWKYLIEFVIVAFGVFLGILASDWNEQNKTNQKVKNMLQYLHDELTLNQENLKKSKEYHEALVPHLDSIQQIIPEELFEIPYFKNHQFRFHMIPNWQGPGLTSIESTVYESAKISGLLQELDINTLQLISKAYLQLENYSRLSDSILDRFLNLSSATKTMDVFGQLEMIKYDVLNMEKYLIQFLEDIKMELIRTN